MFFGLTKSFITFLGVKSYSSSQNLKSDFFPGFLAARTQECDPGSTSQTDVFPHSVEQEACGLWNQAPRGI